MRTPGDPGLTVAEHTPAYPPVMKPPAGAPNVVIIVFDDLGFAQLGSFGSDLETPNVDALAASGLRYNRFHVTSLCSPTRASLFTGRNHHAVGCGFLVDVPLAFPGYAARLPPSAAPLPRVLKDAGYNTFAVGKWHLVPRGERTHAGPFDSWPLGFGFERYYGFLQGDTNHWVPNLVSDNTYVEPPAAPEDGYHLTEDLADTAIRMITDQQHSAPGKPFLLYLALGAMHAPHHVAPEWIARYKGSFDAGWDHWREATFARQVANGVVPAGTRLTERPSWVAAWDALDDGARHMHTRAQEVFAGFLTHTDAQIGRVIAALERLGLRDNTLVMLLSDNGASAEGGQHGTINEHRFSARLPETVADNLAHYDDWGGFRSYNHYSWAWAWAGNTPFRLWKRYTWLGGTRTPLVVSWPRRIDDRGGVRSQFCHAVDVMPTLLDCCNLEMPEAVDGVEQQRVDGASFTATFDDPAASVPHRVQYFEMLGSRSIVDGPWKATTDHVSQGVVDEEELMTGSRDFTSDHWSLFNLDEDFSEANDVSEHHPDEVRRLQQLWLTEAERNQVLPMSDGLTNRLAAIIFPPYPPLSRSVFRPGGSPISDEAVPLLMFGFRMTVDCDVAADAAQGVLFAMGDWTGGYALYATAGTLHFTFRPAGEAITTSSSRTVGQGRHALSVTFTPTADRTGTFTLECDGEAIGSRTADVTVPPTMQHGGARLCLGYDRGFPVADDYSPPFPWQGVIHQMIVETPPFAASTVTDLSSALHAD